jgi:DNA-binding GntR family transcriptional regulator
LLREEILSLELAPGEPVDESTLAERFGVSRSPIREALIRLESDGLIRMTPNKGTLVAPLHLEDFPQYADALDTIQRTVTHLAALQRSDTDISAMTEKNEAFKAAVGRHDVVAMIDANHSFHMAIGKAARNRYLSHMYRRLLDEGRRIHRLYFRSYDDSPPKRRVSNHDKIIAAIRSRDAQLAERLAHEHTLQLSERFIAYFSNRLTAAIPARYEG